MHKARGWTDTVEYKNLEETKQKPMFFKFALWVINFIWNRSRRIGKEKRDPLRTLPINDSLL